MNNLSSLIDYIKSFTFHYGSITIKAANPNYATISTFTFHYGSITINNKNKKFTNTFIYIPLWFNYYGS